jgi:NTE family protein
MPETRKIAIACQGGGSHAAFAAGVLVELLSPESSATGAPGKERREDFEIVGLSGTSGGAMCAALAWRSLAERQGQASEGAIKRLLGFWRDLEVHDLVDALANFWAVSLARSPLTVEVSPYLYEPAAEPRLRELLRTHLDLESFPPHHPGRSQLPRLFIGATDVLNGDRVIFPGASLTYDDLIASAAVPPLFRAVPADGRLYWDGLFATNPPVREFTDHAPKPDEIWVIQINPQRRHKEPRSMRDIIDRRNELAGNLSLSQELYFVHKINEILASHPSLGEQFQPIVVRVVQLHDERLDYPSKLDRTSGFIEYLLDAGRKCAGRFFEDASRWPREHALPTKSVVVQR